MSVSGSNCYKFFSNKECEFFPCHQETDIEKFNCLFCFCPLYTLGDKCGGDFKIMPNGVKDCSMCKFPHSDTNYDEMMKRLAELRPKTPQILMDW